MIFRVFSLSLLLCLTVVGCNETDRAERVNVQSKEVFQLVAVPDIVGASPQGEPDVLGRFFAFNPELGGVILLIKVKSKDKILGAASFQPGEHIEVAIKSLVESSDMTRGLPVIGRNADVKLTVLVGSSPKRVKLQNCMKLSNESIVARFRRLESLVSQEARRRVLADKLDSSAKVADPHEYRWLAQVVQLADLVEGSGRTFRVRLTQSKPSVEKWLASQGVETVFGEGGENDVVVLDASNLPSWEPSMAMFVPSIILGNKRIDWAMPPFEASLPMFQNAQILPVMIPQLFVESESL